MIHIIKYSTFNLVFFFFKQSGVSMKTLSVHLIYIFVSFDGIYVSIYYTQNHLVII